MPYEGTGGWLGSDTSKARAEWMLAEKVYDTVKGCAGHLLKKAGPAGITSKEFEQIVPEHHHGTLSGALSNMHKDGEICRLTEARERNKVYVLPQYVEERETEAFVSSHAKCDAKLEKAEAKVQMLVEYLDATDQDWREKVRQTLAKTRT